MGCAKRLFALVFYLFILSLSCQVIIITPFLIRYNETIISPQETFELGFFNLGNSTNHYVGIWYKKISTRTVVWVANRNTPLTSTSANSSTTSVRNNPVGQLRDTGNIIIYEEGGGINKEDPIWQSFNFMMDTLLPGMKLGRNLVTGIDRHFTSWKSPDDPAFGPWNRLKFTGVSNLKPNRFYNFTFVVNHKEIYYQYNLIDTSVITRLVLQPNSRIERLVWVDSKQEWKFNLARQNDLCDQYAMCGLFGICDIVKSPVCECLKGFEPKSPDEWKITDWSQGCRHTIPLDCDPREGFNKYSNLKLHNFEYFRDWEWLLAMVWWPN
ncbi:putative non-specific serine/threonine protein kinase [Helianthus anomalus]